MSIEGNKYSKMNAVLYFFIFKLLSFSYKSVNTLTAKKKDFDDSLFKLICLKIKKT